MLTTTIGAYPKPEVVPIRDWFQKEGSTDTPEPIAGHIKMLRQCNAGVNSQPPNAEVIQISLLFVR